MTKKKPSNDFSHIETDKIRATFIDNSEKSKELQKEFNSSKSLIIKIGEYLYYTILSTKPWNAVSQSFKIGSSIPTEKLQFYSKKCLKAEGLPG